MFSGFARSFISHPHRPSQAMPSYPPSYIHIYVRTYVRTHWHSRHKQNSSQKLFFLLIRRRRSGSSSLFWKENENAVGKSILMLLVEANWSWLTKMGQTSRNKLPRKKKYSPPTSKKKIHTRHYNFLTSHTRANFPSFGLSQRIYCTLHITADSA